MQLARLDVTSAELESWPTLVSEEDRPLVVDVRDADTVLMMAGVGPPWSGSWGVWLHASDEYPAALIARDVKTLAALMDLDHVVIEAANDAAAHAEVVTALLSDEPATLHNAVASLRAAYNRPAPPRPIQVWHSRGEALVGGSQILHQREVRGGVTIFED